MHRKEGLRTPPEFMITPTVTWADVKAPAPTLDVLVRLAEATRTTSARGIGADQRPQASAPLVLLVGEDRRGRRLAAEAFANTVGAPLLRLDLAAVRSTWRGETEANLDRVFVAAQASDALLLLDEADALFGQQAGGVTPDAAYTPVEAEHLLARIDDRAGVTFMASSLKHNIDAAFRRRAIAEVDFPGRGH